MLNLCKTSVYEFLHWMLSFIPDSTEIETTAIVRNTFPKHQESEENGESSEEEEFELLQPKEDDLTQVKQTKQWLNGLFTKSKNPEPLYILDLFFKPN